MTRSYPITDDFLMRLADDMQDHCARHGYDIARTACVFEGKRPSLFLKRYMARKAKKDLLSPAFFSIDEFMYATLAKKVMIKKMSTMESCYVLYQLACDKAPDIVRGRERFSEFLPWARELHGFIRDLDLEDIANDDLEKVEASAAIGYDIPEAINASLKSIVVLREAYHHYLKQERSFPRGFSYLQAARYASEVNFDEFDIVFFCGFFYMQKTARNLMYYLHEQGKAVCFFQGNENEWPILAELAQGLHAPLVPENERNMFPDIKLYSAFDRHSQVGVARGIVREINAPDQTVIVLPDIDTVLPLVSEIAGETEGFNVSLGYPIKRSSLYGLVRLIIQAQRTRNKNTYYAKDYMRLLTQPLIKNMRLGGDLSITRILVHKIEEALLGEVESSMNGRSFFSIDDILNDTVVFEQTKVLVTSSEASITVDDLRGMIHELHAVLFEQWELMTDFYAFSRCLEKFLDMLVERGVLDRYPLNGKITERLYSLIDELSHASFAAENFSPDDIFKIIEHVLDHDIVSFSGSPLAGLQILGVLETRSLNFKNVIFIDANEGYLPRLSAPNPLIPHEVSAYLGLDMLHKQEEIEFYQFQRLIAGAEKVFFIYEDNGRRARSRFVERLIWEQEKNTISKSEMVIPRAHFSVRMQAGQQAIEKKPDMIAFLKRHRYSASSVNTYLNCPLRFYYRYVLGLKEKEYIARELEAKDVGTFIHELLEDMFLVFIGKRPCINEAFRKKFFDAFKKKFTRELGAKMRSDAFLLEQVMRVRLDNFLTFEADEGTRAIQEIIYLEQSFKEQLNVDNVLFDFTYIVDRVDRYPDGSLVILDYKTGADSPKPKSTNMLEKMTYDRESILSHVRSFQLPLYYYFEKNKYPDSIIKTALYNLRTLDITYFPDAKSDAERSLDICMEALRYIMREIVDPGVPFVADLSDERRCRYCPFWYMCK